VAIREFNTSSAFGNLFIPVKPLYTVLVPTRKRGSPKNYLTRRTTVNKVNGAFGWELLRLLRKLRFARSVMSFNGVLQQGIDVTMEDLRVPAILEDERSEAASEL